MVVDAGDTGVLLHLFLVNVSSLKHEEEKLLKRWAFFLTAQYCHLTREYKNAYSILATSPNAEGLKTNHRNITNRRLAIINLKDYLVPSPSETWFGA